VSESKHTPGPWSVYETYPPHLDGSNSISYSVHQEGADHGRSWIDVTLGSSEEDRANANLIAAAPEMYEALRYTKEYKDKGENTDTFHSLIDTALAKAEGKEVSDD